MTVATKVALRVPFAAVLLLMFSELSGCSRDHTRVEAIPNSGGKGFVSGYWQVSVSPDERWVSFFARPADWMALDKLEFCSLDLTTYQKTIHTLDHVDLSRSEFAYNPWVGVLTSFEPNAWSDGKCYVFYSTYSSSSWLLSFTPGEPSAEWARRPEGLDCSDCPSVKALAIAQGWQGVSPREYDRYSVQADGDTVIAVYCVGAGPVIQRVDATGHVETIVERGKRGLKVATPSAVRLSPDGRYLAYSLTWQIAAPIPTPYYQQEVHLLELASGRDRRVAKGYRYVGNLTWSPDSRRIYFLGATSEEGWVYRVTIE
jgi:hypothetical protein